MNPEQYATFMADLDNLSNRMATTKANLDTAETEALTQRVQIKSLNQDLNSIQLTLASEDN